MRVNVRRLAGNLGVRPIQVRAALRLLQAGNTVPYLAYYGRARTGGLSETALRHLARYLEEQKRLAERKQSVLKHIEGQERLTAELRESILRAEDAPQLEELFYPFKQPQETPADQAHAQGLSKLADAVWTSDPVAEHLQDLLPTFVNPDVGLNTPEEVLEGVRHLLAERLSQLWQWRRVGRKALREQAELVARRHPELPEGEGQEYRDFFDFRERIRRLRPYILLALVQGERSRALQLDIACDVEKIRQTLLEHFPIQEHRHLELIRSAAEEAVELYLIPALLGELRRKLYQRAEDYAAEVIAASLRRLALVRPMTGYRVLAIDPGLRPGCRVAVLDESGTVLECRLLHLLTPSRATRGKTKETVSSSAATGDTSTSHQSDNAVSSPSEATTDGTTASHAVSTTPGDSELGTHSETDTHATDAESSAAKEAVTSSEGRSHDARVSSPDIEQLCELVKRYEVQVIVIGNNNHCREVEKLVQELIRERLTDGQYSIVSDLGAAQYAGGILGKEELPNLDAGLRLAVSLGRRFQDMLAELVKVDVPSLTGLLNFYDIGPRRAQEAVRHTLESLVNWVGVDLNQASFSQLRYVAGLNDHLARVLVDYRRNVGPFRRREQLLQVPGITEAVYKQAAAFLRIPDGEEPLDSTWLHPDQYDLARRLLQALGFSPEAVREPFRRRELRQALGRVEVNKLAAELGCSPIALREVMNHLSAAGRDPRLSLPEPILRRQLRPVSELRAGEHYYGLVVRLLDFGAFVDIGAEETGLLHRSRMGRSKFHSPREVLTVGQMVSVWVVQVDAGLKRIALSLVPPVARRRRAIRRRRTVRPSPPVTMIVQPPKPSTAATVASSPATAATPAVPASTEITAPTQPSETTLPATPVPPPTVAGPTGPTIEPPATGQTPPSPISAPTEPKPAETPAPTLTAQAEPSPAPARPPRPARKPEPLLSPARETPTLPPDVLSGKRELRTFAELKAFFEARQRLQASSQSTAEQPPASPVSDDSGR
jgi:uncharacterized protein